MADFGQQLSDWWSEPFIRFAVIALGSIACAYAVAWLIARTVGAIARRTVTDLDDKILRALNRPIIFSVIAYGSSWAFDEIDLAAGAHSAIQSVLETAVVWLWALAAFRIGHATLEAMSRRARAHSVIQPRTLPVFDMAMKVTVVAAALYFMFLAWNIDLTAWLASAGIIGIAIGFAAKDTLANLFAGIFILADAPYKLGDFIVLDDGLRGMVTHIGVRSTRILTRDDVEITVPNAIIGNSKIVNEAGGPYIKQRLRIQVDCAYGSDIDRVREVMLSTAGAEGVCDAPAPMVRFRAFGASGLGFELLVWIADPAARGAVIDRLNTRIYKAFAAAGIEIPYSKHDVYIKQMAAPRQDGDGDSA